jgi:serine/threonine protein kinase
MTARPGPTEHDPTVESHRLVGGRYRLGDVLGRSLMSEVRRGEDTLLLRPVAIKLLREDGDPRSVARFEREAQILARLHHPNIVVVFDTGVDGADRFIVMELIEGLTLRELLDKGALPPERAAEITSSVASALEFAHGRGIVHRDVKPANVLLPRGGGVKLVDMGIARLLSAEALTLTTTALGTARYMSPEQARGEPLDGRSDVYSLGCVLFEMLAGRTPFEGNPVALSYAHVSTPAPRVRSINAAVPAAMDELVGAMLEKDPADRPQTAEDVRRSLAAAAGRGPGEVPTIAEPQLAPAITARHLPPAPPAPTAAPAPTAPTAPTARLPAAEPPRTRRPAPSRAPLALGAALAVVVVIALVAAARPDEPSRVAPRSPRAGASPAAQESSPAAEESSPAATPSVTLAPASPEDAAALVLDTIDQGVVAGEVADDVQRDFEHKIDEILRDIDKDEELEKSLHGIEDLQHKIDEAVQRGEMDPARASAIDDALLAFEQSIQDSAGE